MKITKRQLRRIIKEAVEASDQDKEAAFAIIYTSDYIQGYMGRAYNAFFNIENFSTRPKKRANESQSIKQDFLNSSMAWKN